MSRALIGREGEGPPRGQPARSEGMDVHRYPGAAGAPVRSMPGFWRRWPSGAAWASHGVQRVVLRGLESTLWVVEVCSG